MYSDEIKRKEIELEVLKEVERNKVLNESKKTNPDKSRKNNLRLRNLSIASLVFSLTWVLLLVLFLLVFLLQIGYANKYQTVPIANFNPLDENKTLYVPSGFDFIKNNIFSYPTFDSPEQEAAWNVWKNACIGLALSAFGVFLIENILLLILQGITKSLTGELAGEFIEGMFGVLFKLTGFILIVSIFNIFVDIFGGGWLLILIGIILFIAIFVFMIAFAIVSITLCAIILSSITIHKTNKVNSQYNLNV